jgi:hypothetical protein
MRKLYTLFFFFVVLGSNAQSEKSFVKSILAESNRVVLQLSGASEFSEWDEDFIRITTTVQLTNFNDDILKRLFSVGRYSLVSVSKQGALYLTMPKVLRPVSIKGVALNELLRHEVFVPKATKVKIEPISGATKDIN